MAAPGSDPEVRELSLAYARAIAITERLAEELDRTVADLAEYVHQPKAEPDAPATITRRPSARRR